MVMKKIGDLMTVKVDVSNRTVFRVLGIALLFAVGVQLVIMASPALLLIFIAFFLAIALNPPVDYLSRKMPLESRGLATALVFIAVIALLTILISTFLPPLIKQTNLLIEQIPVYVETLKQNEGFITSAIEQYNLQSRSQQIQEGIVNRISGAGEPIVNFLGRVSSSIISMLTVLVVTFFMLIEGPHWVKSFWRVQSQEHRKHRKRLARRMYRVITGFVNGQLLIAGINAVATAVILLILGVPFALPLAATVGILGLIPVIGATIGAVVIIVVGLFQSVTTGIILAIYYVVYQQLENNVIQPAIQSKSLGMSPLLILVSVIIGISLAGILGGLLAIPIAGCIKVLIEDYTARHDLNRD
ncbi:hypothetical protein BRC21_01100 [Candidatus Saccharibacteria bacterium SW_7_54_9]|nr:MAG: hypothetical protein BRC21_01100 [Candidatus Saccharibacteria bacterium SW_7_54_9]